MKTSTCLILAAILSADAAGPKKLPVEHLPNAYRISEKVVSGGLPEGDAGFAELERLGIKTAISVDAMRPDVEAAGRHGIRYVHLPHGYDKVPEATGHALAKAVRDLPGPIYIHCHHGKHRGPAATAVACVEAGLLTPAEAAAVLKTAGTGENYRGLFRSVANARPQDVAFLDALDVEFRETSPIPPLAEAMVELEQTHDRLKQAAAGKWSAPGIDAAHEALMLREHFAELLRNHADGRPEKYRGLLRESEKSATDLEASLSNEDREHEQADVAFKRVTERCANCHREFRDNAP